MVKYVQGHSLVFVKAHCSCILPCRTSESMIQLNNRSVNGGAAGEEGDFGSIESASGQRRLATLLLAHPALESYLLTLLNKNSTTYVVCTSTLECNT